MQILHISDIHFRVQYETAQEGYASVLYRMTNPLELLDRCLERAFSEHPGIKLLMITGDLCDDGKAEDYEVLRTWLTKNLRGIKMIVTPGNHDRKAEFRSGWLGMKVQGEKEADLPYNEHWSGDELDVLSLDSAVFGESDGCFVQGQADWLAEELKKTGAQVDDVPTYETGYVSCPLINEKREFEEGTIDLAVFTSASTVKGFVESTKGLDYSRVRAACIGKQTRAAADSYGMQTYMSEKATIDSLIELVETLKRSEEKWN